MPTVPKYWDSFQNYNVADDLDSKLGVSGTAFTPESDRSRTGGRALHFGGNASVSGDPSFTVNVPSSAHVVVNFWWHIGAHQGVLDRAVLDFRVGTSLTARLTCRDTRIQLQRGTTTVATSATAPPVGPQYWEVVYYSHATTGYFVLYIDGVEFVRFDGDTVGESGGVDSVRIRSGTSSTVFNSNRWTMDDLVVAVVEGGDVGGPVGDVRLGAVNHSVLVPTGDVTANGTPSAGSDNFAMMDDLPNDGDTTHVEWAAPGNKDVYSITGSLPEGTVPIGVKVSTIQRLPTGGTTQVRQLLDDGSSEVQGADQGVGEDYAAQSHSWSESPFTSDPWTKAEVEGLRFGLEARA